MLAPVFESIGRRVAARPKTTVLVWLLVAALGFTLALVGFGGQSLFDRLTSGEPAVPGSDSQKASEAIVTASDEGQSVRLLVRGVDPTDPAVAEVMTEVNADLAKIDGVAPEGGVIDAFALAGGVEAPAAKNLLAADGDGFFVEVNLEADLAADDEAQARDDVEARLGTVDDDLAEVAPGATGIVGSNELIVEEITGQVEEDLKTGEAYALPFALVIMVFVFGGFLAASMPVVGALASIGAGLGVLYGLSYRLEIDASVVNVVSLLGLGLSIDYGLLIVSRFREELHKALAQDDGATLRRRRGDGVVQAALARTMATAGRTVAFSALVVAISIAGLMVFTPDILRAIGAAGLAVILIAVATALTLVPALLVLSRRRLARPGVLGRVPGLRAVVRRTADVVSDEGMFSRLTARVQKHPWWVALGSVVVLVVLALPLLGLQMRNSGIELLPVDATQRVFVDELADQYPASETADLFVVTDGTLEATDAWGQDVAALEGVEAVGSAVPAGEYAVLEVYLTTDDAGGPEAVEAVRDVRALDAPFDAWVGGQAAGQVDFVDALGDRMWWAVGIVVAATLVLLFLMTGSVLIPVKALLTNALSLAASLGVLTFVFQDGHGAGLLDFTPTGGIETYVVALVVAFAFGLAMDYEVFLLARVKELFDAGHSNDEAVRLGLQRSGRIITSAALIIVVVFLGFVLGDLLVIKEVGFALAVAVALDATIVRMLLVPATMTILGRANWWAPRPLRWVHRKLAITH
ncbi:RND superfamily putative drug exporter [Sediminihabitans luteus]|uniref:RND superfamily putative drug exporter n=1 Tax=Sediminihabitans luteus TaxID=1138585 RepID=A0A2M9CQR4_9CELL|nr:MMPL family transporter [Sediminihabitans luteus]PJJ74175.1 RND superfamily putative drug exporter [Sediminihabitans luteus]GII99028.1 putative membrane protein [Sediminihabitans luteus]